MGHTQKHQTMQNHMLSMCTVCPQINSLCAELFDREYDNKILIKNRKKKKIVIISWFWDGHNDVQISHNIV